MVSKIIKPLKRRETEMTKSFRDAYLQQLELTNKGKDIIGFAMVSFAKDGSWITSMNCHSKHQPLAAAMPSAVKDALMRRNMNYDSE
jgi:hypothetical protein